MTPVRTLVGALVLLALVVFSGLLLWPAHHALLDHRQAPSPPWRMVPLNQGANFARSQSNVYLETPQPSATEMSAHGARARRALPLAEAEKILLQKGGRYAKKADTQETDHLDPDLPAVDDSRDGATDR